MLDIDILLPLGYICIMLVFASALVFVLLLPLHCLRILFIHEVSSCMHCTSFRGPSLKGLLTILPFIGHWVNIPLKLGFSQYVLKSLSPLFDMNVGSCQTT